MNDSTNRENGSDEPGSELKLDDELVQFERKLREIQPATYSVDTAELTALAMASTATLSMPTLPIVAEPPRNDRWLLAMSSAWFLGVVVGALAMWAAAPRWQSPDIAAQNIAPTQTNQLQTQQLALSQLRPVVAGEPSNQAAISNQAPASNLPSASQTVQDSAPQFIPDSFAGNRFMTNNRTLELDELGRDYQLTVFTVKHAVETCCDENTGLAPDSELDDSMDVSRPSPTRPESGDAQPSNRRILMKKLLN